MGVLPLEILRPRSRRSLQQEMALAFLLDLLPVTTLVTVIHAVAMNLNADFSVRWESVPQSLVIWFLTNLCAAVGVGAVGVVTQRFWLAMVLMMGIVYLGILGTIGLVHWQVGISSVRMFGLSSHTVENQLWLPIMMGALLTWFMARRWFRMEIGARQ